MGAVVESMLLLVLKILDVADTLDDEVGLHAVKELDEHPPRGYDLHVGQMGAGGLGHLAALGQGEGILLHGRALDVLLHIIGHDRHRDLIEAGGGAGDDVQMPQGDGVEAAGDECGAHSVSSLR